MPRQDENSTARYLNDVHCLDTNTMTWTSPKVRTCIACYSRQPGVLEHVGKHAADRRPLASARAHVRATLRLHTMASLLSLAARLATAAWLIFMC